jgi:hypothetical protein
MSGGLENLGGPSGGGGGREGKTPLRYHLRCIEDLHAMLQQAGDCVPLGSADEQKPAAEGTVEAFGRAETNPVKAGTA